MPFQSEKQRRYLWANEPEIARDWTDTYGSGIAKALGGRIGLRRGSGPGPGGQGARGQATQNPGVSSAPSGPPGGGDRAMTYTAPPTRSRIQDERQQDFRQKQIREDIARREAEKDYTRTGQIKPGPQRGLGFAGSGVGGGLGNWASQFAGSKIGGGLGSMLFGPWGMLLGSLFGRGVGKRGWQARQTDEKETWKDIAFGENTLLSNLLSKKKTPTPTGEGLGGLANARRLMTQSSRIPGANPLLQADPYQQTYLRNPNETFTRGSSMYKSPKRSAKDFIDFDKAYWEGERFPTKYPGSDIARDYNPTEEDLQLDIGPYEGERYKITDMENI